MEEVQAVWRDSAVIVIVTRYSKVVVTSCCNWTEVLSGLYISSGLLNAHQGNHSRLGTSFEIRNNSI